MKFKKPKNGHHFHYCYECKNWTYERTIGCANLGQCNAIKEIPSEQDAYDPPCGLFQKNVK